MRRFMDVILELTTRMAQFQSQTLWLRWRSLSSAQRVILSSRTVFMFSIQMALGNSGGNIQQGRNH